MSKAAKMPGATREEREVNAVALHLQAVMGMLSEFFDGLVGQGRHNIVLVVGAGNHEQYVANVPREHGIRTLQGLLARWQVGLPDTMPGEVAPADLRPFLHLLEQLEASLVAQARGEPAPDTRLTVEMARGNLLTYVGGELAKVNRAGGATC